MPIALGCPVSNGFRFLVINVVSNLCFSVVFTFGLFSFCVNIFLLFRPTFDVNFCIIAIDWFLLFSLLWDCRRNQPFPSIYGFKAKIEVKNETELYIARKSNKMGFLQSKWANCFL